MQQKLPCDLCGQRPFTQSIVAYHRWTAGELRYGYKQRMCFKCCSKAHTTWQRLARTEANDGEDWPTECPGCGSTVEGEMELTYSTWYRGQVRRDTCLPLCWQCTATARNTMMEGATNLEDKPSGVRVGGAPRPDPVSVSAGGDLPW